MEKQTFTPDDDFNDEVAQFEQWLAEEFKALEIPELSDEELRLLTEDQKIDLSEVDREILGTSSEKKPPQNEEQKK